MRRRLFTLASALSLLLFAAVCFLWIRGRSGTDTASWTYDRWLPDRSAASNQVYLISDHRLSFHINWGRVGPYNGQLVWGYYVNADQSRGRPRFRLAHDPYDPMTLWLNANGNPDANLSGYGPVRWYTATRSRPKDGDDFRCFTIGISHWLAALLLLIAPTLWLNQSRNSRRAQTLRTRGQCPHCAYDLRATPNPNGPLLPRCPECGFAQPPVNSSTAQSQ